MNRVRTFLEMIKFEHSLFALPFAYLGLVLAEEGWPRLHPFFWVTMAMVSFRTFAMAANRLVDRAIDTQNPRTSSRALPEKKLTPAFVTMSAIVSLSVFGASSWFLGPLCLRLSPVPVVLASVYPYLKRFTWLSHFVLGIILGIAPYGAWIASRGSFSWVPAWVLIGVTAWVAGFDILYSLQDLEFDRRSGLYSIPARFGEARALGVARLLHGIAWLSWARAGFEAGLGWIFWVGLTGVGILLGREHWLVHRFGQGRLEEAFFNMNAGVSSLLFSAALLDLQLLR